MKSEQTFWSMHSYMHFMLPMDILADLESWKQQNKIHHPLEVLHWETNQ